MFRSLVSRSRTSKLVTLVCMLSLGFNAFLMLTPGRYKVIYRLQNPVNLKLRQEASTSTDGLYTHMTTVPNGSQNRPSVQTGPVTSTGLKVDSNITCNFCPYEPPDLLGPLAHMTQDMTPETLISIFPDMKNGRFRPSTCVPRERLAIIIPYRNRYPHLHVLLHNIIPFLTRQQADATIFVVEQALPDTFNRGALFNAGFLEVDKLDRFDCFIFHDVDLTPLDDRHLYRCGENPKHFSVAINKYNFRMPYSEYFGGAVGFSRHQFLEINGCSNVYFGWGGEDDDMNYRSVNKGYVITRAPKTLARYNMIKHTRDKGNEVNPIRQLLLTSATKRQDIEGLNSIKYKVNSIEYKHLYTWINVSLNKTEILQNSPSYILDAMLAARRKLKITALRRSPLKHGRVPGTAHEPALPAESVTSVNSSTNSSPDRTTS